MKALIILLLSSFSAFSQTYEYGQIFQSQHGASRNKTGFFFGTKYDSAKYYGQHVHMIDAMDEASKRGWEVVSITVNFIDTSNPGVGQTTVVYIKRKKPKTH